MKRFKVFKILYYGFVIVIGVILCFALPGYNQYNALTKEIKSDIKTENFGDIPGFFASYYNNTPVLDVKGEESGRLQIYEATNYEAIAGSSYYYAQEVYMGFIFDVANFNSDTAIDDNGNTVSTMRVEYSDGANTLSKELTKENLTYVTELNFIYFYLPYQEFNESNLENISNIKVFDNKKEDNLFIEGNAQTPLTFASAEGSYFKTASKYVELFNRMYTHLNIELEGTYTIGDGKTTLAEGAKIKYTPTGPVVLRLEGNPDDFTVEGATLIKDENVKNRYQATNGQAITITAKKETDLTQLVVEAGAVSINYNFNGEKATDASKASYETVYTFESNDTKTLGGSFDSAKQETDFNNWLENYTFAKTNYQDALNGVTTKTMLQIVLYIAVFFIIGDFLVGKRHILALCYKIFGKKKKKTTDKVEEVNNDYDVNFSCTVHVPVGYTKPVYVTYQKDMNHIINFELKKEHNYKTAQRTQNGTYKLVSAEAEGLHPIKKPLEVQVRGYRFEVVINFAYDEKKTTSSPAVKPASNTSTLEEEATDTAIINDVEIVEEKNIETEVVDTKDFETRDKKDSE